MLMKKKRLKFKKEIIANLSGTEGNQVRGGVTYEAFGGCVTDLVGCSLTFGMCCSNEGCPSLNYSCVCGYPETAKDSCDPGTSCCPEHTYADCTCGR